jgi:uncharacterized protein DUF6636
MVTAMTLRAGLILVGLSVVLLSGCGGQDPAPTASSPSMQPAKTAPATPTESPAGATKTQAPDASAPDEATDLVGFTSPSGNVGCIIDSAYVRCDISERDWSPPPRPADCEFDYGQGISLSRGERAAFVCAGDTALGGGEPLDYGQSVSAGLMQCDSAESGITCRDTKTGHGFTIAREEYQVF